MAGLGGTRQLAVEWLGRVDYEIGLALQQEAWRERRAGRGRDRLMLLEHPPVVTLGRASRPEHLLLDRPELERRGIGCFEIARGGDVTYHAPGQLVGYLVLDLARRDRDLHAHLRRIEEALTEACEDLGVACKTIPGKTGIFVDAARHGGGSSAAPAGRERKLASIGVGVRHWITQHGFGLNVTTGLEGFEVIVPCGLADVDMTSLQREGARAADLEAAVRERVARAFLERLG